MQHRTARMRERLEQFSVRPEGSWICPFLDVIQVDCGDRITEYLLIVDDLWAGQSKTLEERVGRNMTPRKTTSAH